MHPLIPILRWWLIQALAIALVFCCPEAGLALFAGNCFGWWIGDGCCPSPSTACTGACNGGTLWSTASVTFAGYVAGSCDCTVLNTTFSVPYFSDTVPGCQGLLEPFTCSDENGDGVLHVNVFTGSPHTTISVTWGCLSGAGHNVAFQNNSTLGASPIDCNSISGLSLINMSDGSCNSDGICNPSSATCSVSFT